MARRTLAEDLGGIAGMALALSLAACDTRVKAPDQPGVCYRVSVEAPASLKFTPISTADANMETCAAHLEYAWKDTHREVVGAYGGAFIFIDATGIRSGNDLEGPQYQLLTPEGRLQIDQAIDAVRAAKAPR